MNKKLNDIRLTLLRKKVQAKILLQELPGRARASLQSSDGLGHTVEVLLWVVGAVIFGGGVIVAMAVLINSDILPQLKTKINDIFSHTV